MDEFLLKDVISSYLELRSQHVKVARQLDGFTQKIKYAVDLGLISRVELIEIFQEKGLSCEEIAPILGSTEYEVFYLAHENQIEHGDRNVARDKELCDRLSSQNRKES